MNKRVACLFAFVCLLMAGVASAASRGKGVVMIVEGADADVTRRDITQSIPEGLAVQPSGDLAAALVNQGVSGSLADALANPKTRKQTLSAVRKSLAQVGVAAVISARSKKIGKGATRDVRIVLIVGSQAEPVIEENIAIGKGDRGAQKFQPLLSVPLQDVASVAPSDDSPREAKAPLSEKKKSDDPPGAAPVEDSTPTDKDQVAKPRPPVDLSNALIVAEVGGGIGTRNFKYSSPVYGQLRGYAAPGVGMWAIGAQVYPFAAQGIPFAKDIGVVGRLSGALKWESKTSDGHVASGAWSRYSVGVRGRIRAGDGPGSPLIGVEGTYNGWKFDFSGTDVVAQEIPSVEYKYLCAAADIRLPFGAFSLLGGAGYLNMLSGGFSKLPHATAMGVDARVGAAYSITPWLEAKATADYVRIGMNAKPQIGDGTVAGGALDQYFVFNLGVSAIF